MNIKRNLINLIKAIELNQKKAIPYIGCDSNGNLGDIELFNISKKYLNHSISNNSHALGRFVSLATKNSRYFIIAGGTLLFTTPILKQSELLLKSGKKPILLGSGAGEFLNNDSEFIKKWKKLLLQSPFLGVRGIETSNTLKKLGLDSVILGDLGYLINLESEKPKKPENKIIIVARSLRPSVYKYFSDDFLIREKLATIINNFHGQYKIIVYSVGVDDYIITRSWFEHLKITLNVEYKEYFNDFSTFIQDIETSKLVISMRMHPGIFALAKGVPTMELDYRIKYKDSFGILNLSEQQFTLVNPIKYSDEYLISKIENMLNGETKNREIIFEEVRKIAIKQKNELTIINKMLERNQ